jgi:hypothetical protein
MAEEVFEIGDLICVSGGFIGKEGEGSNTADVCIVAAVGEQDLIVEQVNMQSSFKVPKALCSIINKDPNLLKTCRVLEPDIGDLVLSFERKYYSSEAPTVYTGVLYKLSYKMGTPDRCTLLCGTDFAEVSYKSLMVVQKRKNH